MTEDPPDPIRSHRPPPLHQPHDLGRAGWSQRPRLNDLASDGPVISRKLGKEGELAVFENADVIDIERHNADRHLSFGYGIHFCMGSRLAELQLRVLWEEILERFERIEIQEEPERTYSSFVHGYTRLPVTVTRR